MKNITPANGSPLLGVVGTSGPDVLRVGDVADGVTGRVNMNLDNDEDFFVINDVPEQVQLLGGGGGDFISGQGYGSLKPTLSHLHVEGGAGQDRIFGGNSGDNLAGGDDGDTLITADGALDFVAGGSGSDNALLDTHDIDEDGIESKVIGAIGRLQLAPRTVTARAGRPSQLTMSWTHPKAWRELREIYVGLYSGDKQVAMVAVRPQDERLAATGAAQVMTGASHVTHHGKTVKARIAMRLARSLAGETLRIGVRATDRHGHSQMIPDAGVVRVAK